MQQESLDAIRVTAERVQRFARDVECGADARDLWRAALDDLRALIRRARAEGIDPALIHHAALGVETRAFVRLAEQGREPSAPASRAA